MEKLMGEEQMVASWVLGVLFRLGFLCVVWFFCWFGFFGFCGFCFVFSIVKGLVLEKKNTLNYKLSFKQEERKVGEKDLRVEVNRLQTS